MKLVWLPRALETRREQIAHIAKDKPRAALEQGDEIERQVELLLTHPELGRQGRVKGTRELVIVGTPFIVPYRIRGPHIEVLRVLHGAQQWPKRF